MIKTYKVQNLDCANCAAKLERALSKIDGVNSADDRSVEVIADVRKTCKKVEPDMEVKFI